jgi:hypothetical protein
VDHWLYLMTISLGPTPVSRTAKTLGKPRCMERVRPTLTWSPSRFCAQSVLLWGVDTCKMICQYSALIESFLFLNNVPSMQPEDSSRILPSAIHGGYTLTNCLDGDHQCIHLHSLQYDCYQGVTVEAGMCLTAYYLSLLRVHQAHAKQDTPNEGHHQCHCSLQVLFALK